MNLTKTHGVSRRAFLGAAAAAAAAQAAAPAEYPLYRVRGTHREMGRQHGEQAASKIKAHLEVIQKGSKLNREQLRRRAARYQPMFDKYCPHLLEEMRGIAEGAGVTFEEAMACSIRGGVG